MQAMILAAGLSTRLRPFSLNRPKPLFPILNQPLLALTVNRLKTAGFSSITVNTHHLGEQIELALARQPGITLQPEEIILGTGGGLRRALPNFGDEPVLVVNGDIYHSLDFSEIYRRHCQNDAQVTMVTHAYPRFNTVTVNAREEIISFDPKRQRNSTEKMLAYTGVQVINPEVLRLIEPDRFSGILDCYQTWRQQGGRIKSMKVQDHFWTDIGTVADYLDLHAGLIAGRIPAYPEIAGALTDQFVIAASAVMADDVQLADWVCVGPRARIGKGAELSRVVVWDGAEVAPGARIADTIITG